MNKKEFFAQTISQDQVTQDSANILKQMVMGGVLLGNRNYVGNFIPDVKNKFQIGYLASSSADIKTYNDTFTSTDSLSISYRSLEIGKYCIQEELGSSELDLLFYNQQNGSGVGSVDVGSVLGNAITELFIKKMSAKMDVLAFQSSGGTGTTVLAQITGLLARASADSGTNKVTGTTLTKANIQDELDKVYAKFTSDAKAGSMKIYVSDAAHTFYKQALGSNALMNGLGATDGVLGTQLWYDTKVEIVPTVGMPTNRMIAIPTEALFVGLDAESDWTGVRIVDLRNSTGDNKVRFIANFGFDINYAQSDVVTVYG